MSSNGPIKIENTNVDQRKESCDVRIVQGSKKLMLLICQEHEWKVFIGLEIGPHIVLLYY